MTRATSLTAAVLMAAAGLVAAGAGRAAAQEVSRLGTQPVSPAAPVPTSPRVELGGGAGIGLGWFSGEPGGLATFLPSARVSTAFTPRWGLEGVFDFLSDGDGDLTVVYRVQARWRFKGEAAPGRLQPHLTIGATGSLARETWGPYEWRDTTGALHQVPRQTSWSMMPPWLPTVGFGIQKTLGAHVALRADLAAIIVPADDFVGVLLMPSISVSIPIGRYPTARSR